ncbi:unnamed protein product [Mycena citricolor]|uniref:Uncharacterized protein n=1 Tax=Mycena citricolor TaxID=2018698 RepID=A0AAD2HQ70_9AGAR|nr:unnamed protein product [Mycena citricolor]
MWNSSHASFNGDFAVLYVAVEQITDNLMTFLQGLVTMRRLAHLVVDKAHMVLTDASFREPIRHIIRFARELKVQITLLSGSIGPQHVSPLLDTFDLTNVHILCMLSWRSNLEYLVSIHPPRINSAGHHVKSFVQAAVKYIQWRLCLMSGYSYRIIVYCRGTQVACKCAEKLGVQPYYAAIDTELRHATLKAW